MTTVKEWALRQLHWLIQEDPWTREIMLAGGGVLDELAERILAVYNSDNFDRLNLAQVRYYERILGLRSDETKSLTDRRSAIQAAWNISKKPSLTSVQAICDAWNQGGIIASYEPGTLTLNFIGGVGVPANIEDLIRALEQNVPPQIVINYNYRFLLIREVHDVMTLEQIESTTLNNFAGG